MRLMGAISKLLAARVLQRILLALAVIEAIFIAESLTGLLERVLSFGGASWHVGAILLLTSPEIFDFALPLALMIGVYTALVAAREDSEFIVSSAAGASWRRIPGFIVVTGLIGAAVSVVVAGYVAPLAAYGKRVILLDLQTTQIREQISDTTPRDTLRTFAGRTFVVTSGHSIGQARGQLFIRHPPEGDGWRVTQAHDWTTIGPDAGGRLIVTFRNVLDYAFTNIFFGDADSVGVKSDRDSEPQPVDGDRQPPRFSAIGADAVSLPIELDKIIAEADRLRQDRELTLTELLGGAAPDGDPAAAGQDQTTAEDQLAATGNQGLPRRFGELVGRALLCPVACLLALVGFIAARGGISRYAALPAAGVGVLAFDTVSRQMLGVAAENGLSDLALKSMLLMAAAAVPLLAAVALHGERIIRPADGRA